jgi:cytoskeletal protein CcmA (bactofilin family)
MRVTHYGRSGDEVVVSELPDDGTLTAEARNVFNNGHCHSFALALSQLTGWRLWGLSPPTGGRWPPALLQAGRHARGHPWAIRGREQPRHCCAAWQVAGQGMAQAGRGGGLAIRASPPQGDGGPDQPAGLSMPRRRMQPPMGSRLPDGLEQLPEPNLASEAGATPSAVINSAEQATIGKSLVIKGEVSGSESLYIDGRMEGSINLAGNRVTVGRNGVVAANINAREIVVLGKVRGNLVASDRVDIRNEGSLTGDVVAQHISIEDGAFFKGGIDIRKPGQKINVDAKEVPYRTKKRLPWSALRFSAGAPLFAQRRVGVGSEML